MATANTELFNEIMQMLAERRAQFERDYPTNKREAK